MGKSHKKPYLTISKKWDKFKEHSYRHKIKQSLQGFDPDRDWEELNLSMKGIEAWGTKCGFDIEPDEDDITHDWYEKAKRK